MVRHCLQWKKHLRLIIYNDSDVVFSYLNNISIQYDISGQILMEGVDLAGCEEQKGTC